MQGGQAQALHDRVGVLDAVAEGARVGIHQHALERHAHVAHQDVELLGQVHVDRRLADHDVVVAQRGGDDSPVVLVFAEPEGQSLALGRLGDGDQYFVVFVGNAGPVDDQRQATGGEHRLDRGDAGVGRRVALVGVRAAQLQGDDVGPQALGFGGPGRGVMGRLPPRLEQRRRPVGRVDVAQLGGDRRAMGKSALEVQEGQRLFAADRHGAAAGAAFGAECDRAYRAGPLLDRSLYCGHVVVLSKACEG